MIGNNLGKGSLSRPRRPEKDNGRKPRRLGDCTDESLSAWIALRKSRPFPTICSCPIYSSRLRGRIRAASGSRSAAAAVSNKSLLTVPLFSVRIIEPPQSGIFRIRVIDTGIDNITVSTVIKCVDRIEGIFPDTVGILIVIFR